MYQHMPFIAFLACLAMVYIANAHKGERMMREIQVLEKEEKRTHWRALSFESEMSKTGTQSRVEQLVVSDGLKVPVEPPKKLIVKDKK